MASHEGGYRLTIQDRVELSRQLWSWIFVVRPGEKVWNQTQNRSTLLEEAPLDLPPRVPTLPEHQWYALATLKIPLVTCITVSCSYCDYH